MKTILAIIVAVLATGAMGQSTRSLQMQVSRDGVAEVRGLFSALSGDQSTTRVRTIEFQLEDPGNPQPISMSIDMPTTASVRGALTMAMIRRGQAAAEAAASIDGETSESLVLKAELANLVQEQQGVKAALEEAINRSFEIRAMMSAIRQRLAALE